MAEAEVPGVEAGEEGAEVPAELEARTGTAGAMARMDTTVSVEQTAEVEKSL